VNNLYFNQGYTKRQIARQENVSTDFVVRWTQSPDQDFEEDNRGWKKGFNAWKVSLKQKWPNTGRR